MNLYYFIFTNYYALDRCIQHNIKLTTKQFHIGIVERKPDLAND